MQSIVYFDQDHNFAYIVVLGRSFACPHKLNSKTFCINKVNILARNSETVMTKLNEQTNNNFSQEPQLAANYMVVLLFC